MRKGQELLDSLRADLEFTCKDNANREDRMMNNELDLSDCYLSRRAGLATVEVIKAKINILENEGLAMFPALYDKSGELLSEDIRNGKFGSYFVLKSGEKVSYHLTYKTLEKKGYEYGNVKRAAWATYCNSDMPSARVFRSDFNYWTGEEA